MATSQQPAVTRDEGRELLLEFTGSPPELTKTEFCYSKEFERFSLGKGKPGLQWNSLAKAFSTCVLKYLCSDPKEDETVTSKGVSREVFEFTGPPRNSHAASLGDAVVVDKGRWVHMALVKKKGDEKTSIVHEIFLRGFNVAGRSMNSERRVHLDTKVLPRDCIRIVHRQTPRDVRKEITGKQLGDLLAAIPTEGKLRRKRRSPGFGARVG